MATVMGGAEWNMRTYPGYMCLSLEDNRGCLICINDISADPVSMVRSPCLIQRNMVVQLEAHLTGAP